jgi:hypothetical protein
MKDSDEILRPKGDNYWELTEIMCSADPRLIHWNIHPAAGKPAWPCNRSRAIALRLEPDSSIADPITFASASHLQSYLRSPSGDRQRTVYILKGLAPEFVEVFGSHFRLHPSVFLDHERLVAFDGQPTGEAGGIPFLVSTIRRRDHVSLKYHEALVFSPPRTSFRNFCDHTGRHIRITRVMGRFSPISVARRKCSFWCRRNNSDTGWECELTCTVGLSHTVIN